MVNEILRGPDDKSLERAPCHAKGHFGRTLSDGMLRRADGMLRRASHSVRRRLSTFTFTAENFRDPALPHGLSVIDVPVVEATNETLAGYGPS